MRMLVLLCGLAGCSLNVDYTGTSFACGEGGNCPPGYVCVNEICIPDEPAGPECSTSLGAGGQHGCSVRSDDGTVWCWGRNNDGQLGNNTAVDAVLPVQVEGITGATLVAAGNDFTCAIVSGGVKCWGENDRGQLGDGSDVPSKTPVDVIGLTGVTALAMGEAHVCALEAGVVSCWGANGAGQLGDSTDMDKKIPAVVPGIVNASAIAASDDSSCAVDGGTLKCWGFNGEGLFMTGDTNPAMGPVSSTLVSSVAGVAIGGGHLCIFDTAGVVQCAGANEFGQLGNGVTTAEGAPNPMPSIAPIPARVTEISAAGGRSCAVDEQHRAWCWGADGFGRLGLGVQVAFVASPTLTQFKDVASVSAGGDMVCARSRAGSIACAGINSVGQLGSGIRTTQPLPHEVPNLSGVQAIAAGNDFTCAVLTDKTVQCWGQGDFGQLGDGSLVTRPLPGPAIVVGAEKIFAGDDDVCVVHTDGSVSCWGEGLSGQLGAGTGTRGTPLVVEGISNPDQLILGDDHTCARTGTSVRCWGNNTDGRLGDPAATTGPSLVSLNNGFLGNLSQLAVGGAHTCVIDDANEVQCWGSNGIGQLGNGTCCSGSSAPTKAVLNSGGNVTGVQEIAARGGNTYARVGGTVFGWGNSCESRIFGASSFCSFPFALQIPDITNAAKLVIGFNVACVLRTDGTVSCWGSNGFGQVGDGTYGSTTPTTVPGLTDILDITAGDEHVCAIKADHTVVCWGNDSEGELGDGVIEDRGPSFVRLRCE
jgi:alpha-tubulin suppressor-like RCC1 family protein